MQAHYVRMYYYAHSLNIGTIVNAYKLGQNMITNQRGRHFHAQFPVAFEHLGASIDLYANQRSTKYVPAPELQINTSSAWRIFTGQHTNFVTL